MRLQTGLWLLKLGVWTNIIMLHFGTNFMPCDGTNIINGGARTITMKGLGAEYWSLFNIRSLHKYACTFISKLKLIVLKVLRSIVGMMPLRKEYHLTELGLSPKVFYLLF